MNPPTSVEAESLEAIATTQGVRVTWRTAQELRIAGFNLYRASGATSTRLNAHLIRAKHSGSLSGAGYCFLDSRTRAGRSYTYRLQLVRLDGTRAWVGSTTVRALR